MSKMNQLKILDAKCWSPLWDDYLKESTVFDPLKVREITCIVPIPDRSEVLVFSDEGIFLSARTALASLRQFSFAHCFPDYGILSSVLKDIDSFGKYKFPWACPYFTLCPLEGGNQGVWINPLKIENIYKLDGLHYARLLNGMKLIVPISRYYALLRAEVACGILAAIRQDTYHFSVLGNNPSEYVALPNTAFAHSLAKRPLLKNFVTRKYEMHRRYQRARFLHYFEQLETNPQDLRWENWQ